MKIETSYNLHGVLAISVPVTVLKAFNVKVHTWMIQGCTDFSTWRDKGSVLLLERNLVGELIFFDEEGIPVTV